MALFFIFLSPLSWQHFHDTLGRSPYSEMGFFWGIFFFFLWERGEKERVGKRVQLGSLHIVVGQTYLSRY